MGQTVSSTGRHAKALGVAAGLGRVHAMHIWAPGEAAGGPAGGLALGLLLGPGGAVVAVVVAVLGPQLGQVLAVPGDGHTQHPRHLGQVQAVGGVPAGSRRLAAGRPEHPLHMLVQDALRVLLVCVPQPPTARLHVAGREVVPGRCRGQLVGGACQPRRPITVLAFLLLWGTR